VPLRVVPLLQLAHLRVVVVAGLRANTRTQRTDTNRECSNR
jgi:hypothetical protein